MKKYLIAALASVAALTLASCVKESSSNMTEEKTINNSQELITITARIPEGGFTKVDMNEAAYGGAINLVWHAGDKIIVTDADDETNTQEFTLTGGAGTTEGTFTGKVVTADSYIIVYDSIGDEFEFSEQTQAADATRDHLKYKAVLTSVNDYTDFEFSDYWASSAGGTFTSSSVLRVRAKLGDLDPAEVYAVILKASDEIFAGSNELKVNISTHGEDGAGNEMDFITVYATLPVGNVNIADGTKLIAQFQMSDKSYDKYTVFRELGAGTITGGKVNSFNIDCGENFTKFANKSDENIGTEDNPYLIGDQHQMVAMHDELESGSTIYYTLIDDVDLTDVEWVPLNPSGPYDKGIYFDGANHTVYNLHSTTAAAYPSFAGVVNGTIKDVTFESPVVEGTDTQVGPVCGYLGTSSYDGTCIGVTVSNATVTSNVSSGVDKGRYAGGFAGYIGTNNSSLVDCHVTGTTTVINTDSGANKASTAGGFIGYTDKNCTITDCTVSGNVTVTMNTTKNGCSVGGFIGGFGTAATIKRCTVAANVNNPSSYYTGGFIGQAGGAIEVSDCAFLGGDVTAGRNSVGNSPVGGFIGRITDNAGASFTNCYVDGAHITALKSGRVGGFLGDGGKGATANTYTSCYVINSSVSAAQNSGGFAGTLYGKADKCFVESTTITANDKNVGGFVGFLENGTATNCYAIATVVGGECANIGGFAGNVKNGGNVPGQITYSFANSTISGSATSVGAFMGNIEVVPNAVTNNIAWNSDLPLYTTGLDSEDVAAAVHDNYCGTEGTISSQATALGWNTDVWNLSGDVPVLK